MLFPEKKSGPQQDNASLIRPTLRLNGVSPVVSAMPGAGKSTLIREMREAGLRVSDSDSQPFHFLTDEAGQYLNKEGQVTTERSERVANPNFVRDYVNHIKEQLEVSDIVFVSAHEEVRKALSTEGIGFDLVRHKQENVEFVAQMIENRDSKQPNQLIADVVRRCWDEWFRTIDDRGPQNIYVIDVEQGQFLATVLGFNRNDLSLNPAPETLRAARELADGRS